MDSERDFENYFELCAFINETCIISNPILLQVSDGITFSLLYIPHLSDAAGNEYDLSDLSKEGEPWVAIDTSKEAKKQTFFLNVCKPLPYVSGCPGKSSGKHFL